MAKLKLDAIKSWQKPETKKQETSNENVLPDISAEKNTKIIPPTIEQEEIKKTKKISLSHIKSSQQNKEKNETTKQKDDLKTEFEVGAHCKMKNIELFPAYTSKFKRQQWSMLQRIQQLKRLPTTNKAFVLLAIWITLLWVSGLFILAPEKHNVQNYKANIFEAYNTIRWKNTLEEIPPKPTSPDVITEKNQDTTPVEIDTAPVSFSWSVDESHSTQSWSIQRDIQYYQNIKSQILNKSSQ